MTLKYDVNNYKYFNAGVTLINCIYFKKQNILEKAKEIVYENYKNDIPLYEFYTQGVLNILFTKNYEGVILYSCIKGIHILEENDNHIKVKVGSGENWDDFVKINERTKSDAKKLVEMAQQGSKLRPLTKQFVKLSGGCKTCHKGYRKKK
jgi:UDP-N-acetylenolpyruvoylglucosamine reductase